MNTGIYKITNTITGKCYIGSAVNINRRFNKHKSELSRNKHHSKYLQNSYNKYGLKVFTFEILFYCSKEDLLFYEQRALDTYKPEYNMYTTAGSPLGHIKSEETRKKLSQSLTGKKRAPFSDEHRNKLAIHNSKPRKPLSAEHKAKLSEYRKNNPNKRDKNTGQYI